MPGPNFEPVRDLITILLKSPESVPRIEDAGIYCRLEFVRFWLALLGAPRSEMNRVAASWLCRIIAALAAGGKAEACWTAGSAGWVRALRKTRNVTIAAASSELLPMVTAASICTSCTSTIFAAKNSKD